MEQQKKVGDWMSYQIGMEVNGTVTGIQPYGVFVALDEEHQGLIHISEVQHGYIKNVEELLDVGQKVRVKVIDIDEYSQKISLSLRVYDMGLPKARRRKKRYFTNKNKKIGFSSLEKKLPVWIEESLGNLHGRQEKKKGR